MKGQTRITNRPDALLMFIVCAEELGDGKAQVAADLLVVRDVEVG